MSEYSAPNEKKTTRRRKVQAVMAGGLVLGVGAVVTLAAWNDSEFAEGIFGAADFNLQGSTDGVVFEDHETEDAAATMDFAADNIIPGETVYAPFSVRLDADTTVGGTIEEENGIEVVASEGDNVEHLSYSVYAGPETCDADGATTGTEVAGGADLSAAVGSTNSITLDPGTEGEAGEEVALCFVVTADSEELIEDGDTTATWHVLATSDEG